MQEPHLIRRKVLLTGLYAAAKETVADNGAVCAGICDHYELVLCLSGALVATAGGNAYLLGEREAILYRPTEFRNLRAADGPCALLHFVFDAAMLPDCPHPIFAATAECRARAERALRLLHDAMDFDGAAPRETKEGREIEAQEAVNELEIALLLLTAGEAGGQTVGTTAGLRNFRHALVVLQKNLSLPLNTAELAERANMSPSLLKKTFTRYAGVGVMEYFRTQKVNAAIPLLRDGASVREAAAKFGFSDPGYFSTVFRRVTGHAPTYYRTH